MRALPSAVSPAGISPKKSLISTETRSTDDGGWGVPGAVTDTSFGSTKALTSGWATISIDDKIRDIILRNYFVCFDRHQLTERKSELCDVISLETHPPSHSIHFKFQATVETHDAPPP